MSLSCVGDKCEEGEPSRVVAILPGWDRPRRNWSSLLCKIIVIILALLILGCGISNYVVVTQNQHRTSTLAIASDVIECAKPSLLYRYDKIVVNETPSDSLNDNPKGLVMDLFTLNENDIKYHTYLDHHTEFELIIPTTGVNKFIIPYEYYNRPWYFWKGSSIDINFKILYKQKPSKAVLYLFRSDVNINSFFSKKNSIKYERQLDMISLDGKNSVHWSVKHNDYYYVAVQLVGSKDTIFKANLTFNFTYIDVDDYSWIKDTAQIASGVNQPLTLHHSISSGNTNLTLCYLHALPANSLDSNSIHINTDYYLDDTVKALLIAVPFGVLILYFITVMGCYWICTSRKIWNRKEKNGYILIN